MISTLNWQADKLYACILLEHFSAQSISALDLCLRGKAFVVIRQNALSHKSSVWACSGEAQKLNIKRGSFAMDLKKKYRELKLVKQNYEYERTVVEDLAEIIRHISPDFEIRGNGIFMINLSHLLLNPENPVNRVLLDLRKKIKTRVNFENIAIGVSASKIVSWIMARTVKPEGVKFCTPKEERTSLSFLNCSFLPGLSYGCRQRLKKYGLNKIGQLQQFEKIELVRRFGQEGEKIYGIVRGIDFRLREVKTIPVFAETVFEKDIIDQGEINEYTRHTVDKLCYRLKLKRLLADKITLVIRYTDNKSNQRTTNLPFSSNDFNLIADLSKKLFLEVYLRRVSIKSLRVIVKKPVQDFGQLKLFETVKEKKQRMLQKGVVNIRKRFFFDTVFNASELACVKLNKKTNSKKVSKDKISTKVPDYGKIRVKDKRILFGCSDNLKIKGKTIDARAAKGQIFSEAWDVYQKKFSFLELSNTYRNEPLTGDFKLIDSLSRAMVFSVVVHHKVSQPKLIDIKEGVRLITRQLCAAGALFRTGKLYSFLIRLKANQIRNQRMLNYLIKISKSCLKAKVDVHLEFTHSSWYTEYVFDTLKKNKIGICNPGIIGLQNPVSTRLACTGKAYIRYDKQNSDFKKFLLEENQKISHSSFALKKTAEKIALVYKNGSWHEFSEIIDNR